MRSQGRCTRNLRGSSRRNVLCAIASYVYRVTCVKSMVLMLTCRPRSKSKSAALNARSTPLVSSLPVSPS